MDKNYYMALALEESKKCIKSKDVPVGAVIVKDGKVLSKAHNTKEKKQNCLNHAEILAINKASKKVKNFRLSGCEIYVTKEPCLMCMGAILSARIDKIYYGSKDKRFGTIKLAKDNNFNHKCDVEGGILNKECDEMLSNFFSALRGDNEDIRSH
ncbi:MAG: nucleoside deaminase [Clostridiales bacterium]|nr:nucleoside deaminase [Clostridiales bacterium]